MPQYTTVFEITQKGFDWWFPAVGVVFILVSIFNIRRRMPGYKWNYLGIVLGVLWIPLTFWAMYPRYQACWRDYAGGHYLVAEGAVEDFDPMPFAGHQEECFTVQGVRFCYSDYEVVCGFNNTSSHGGPIRSGLPVRVSYQGNTILKLEISSDHIPSRSEVWKREISAIGTGLISFWPVVVVLGGLRLIVWIQSKGRSTTG